MTTYNQMQPLFQLFYLYSVIIATWSFIKNSYLRSFYGFLKVVYKESISQEFTELWVGVTLARFMWRPSCDQPACCHLSVYLWYHTGRIYYHSVSSITTLSPVLPLYLQYYHSLSSITTLYPVLPLYLQYYHSVSSITTLSLSSTASFNWQKTFYFRDWDMPYPC